MKTALVLSGGGARAAYQVGVLNAVSDLLPPSNQTPFPIICGTSAGAINAASIATRAEDFHAAASHLSNLWSNLHSDMIHYVGYGELLKSSFKLLGAFFHSGISQGRPLSLLDNTPLFHLLVKNVKLENLNPLINQGKLHALSITSLAYSSGHSINFFQGHDSIEPWNRSRRIGQDTNLSLQHLMASSAIPAVFPAVRIDNDYYGDGAIRQTAPMSAALHLGADKIFVVGVGGDTGDSQPSRGKLHSPSLAQISGQLLNSAFIDAMEEDIDMLERFNDFIRKLSKEQYELLGVRPVEVLHISPSIAFDEIAADHVQNLPRPMRAFLKTIGATRSGGGSSMASYLLFESGYCQELMQHGYQDCMQQKDKVIEFLGD